MTEKRFSLSKDTEWWFVQDNAIQVNKYGYRDDLTGEDEYRGLHQELTEQETVDLLNEQHEQIERLKLNFRALDEVKCEIAEENEQLKKELKRCRDWLNSDKNDYQLTLAFIKSKGYSLKDVLEYEKELEE